jgi:hypothetical protein
MFSPQHPSKVIHRPSLATKRRKHGCVKSQQLKVTSINESLELIDSHVRYLPDESSINARLGKQVSKNGPAVEHTIDVGYFSFILKFNLFLAVFFNGIA